MPNTTEAWNEVTHYAVNVLSENPNASNEEIEGKIAESLFNNGYSEEVQNEVMEDADKLNKIIDEARKAEVREACVNIANKLDVLGFMEEASMVDDIIIEASKIK